MIFSLFYVQTAYAGGGVTEGGETFIFAMIGGLVLLAVATYFLTFGKKET